MALRAVSSRQAFHLKASAGDPASDLVLRVQKSLRTPRLKLEHAQQATLLSKLRAKLDCPKQAGVETAEKLLGKDDLFDPEDVPTWCIASVRCSPFSLSQACRHAGAATAKSTVCRTPGFHSSRTP